MIYEVILEITIINSAKPSKLENASFPWNSMQFSFLHNL